MQDEFIAQQLEQACQNPNLIIQVMQDSHLHVYLNRDNSDVPDYTELQRTIAQTVLALELPAVERIFLYSRLLGEVDPDWQTCLELRTGTQERAARIAPSENRVASATPLPEAASASQPLQRAQYCFIRNRMMLTAELLPPSGELAQLVEALDALSEDNQSIVLSNLDGFFKTGQRPDNDSLPPPLQEWFGDLEKLKPEDARKAPIWISRYCFDRETTLTIVQEVLQAQAAASEPAASTEEDTAPSAKPDTGFQPGTETVRRSRSTLSFEEESLSRGTNRRPSAENRPARAASLPQTASSSRDRAPKSAQISPWALLAGQVVVALLILVVVVQWTAPPSIAKVCGSGQSLYCSLLADMMGTSALQDTAKYAAPLTPESQGTGVQDCGSQMLALIEETEDTPAPNSLPLKTHSEAVLPGILAVDIQVENSPQYGRTVCAYQGTSDGLRLAAIGSIPQDWPQTSYKSAIDSRIVHVGNAYQAILLLGANTLFTAIGLAVVGILGLAIRFYSLQGLVGAAMILGWTETIFSMILPAFGFFGAIARQSLLLLVTSLFIKDLKIDWTGGYFSVSVGVLVFMIIRGVLHFLLIGAIFTLVS